MKKIIILSLLAVLCACNSGDVTTPVRPPVPPTDTTFHYGVVINSNQSLTEEGYDTRALKLTGYPSELDESENPVQSRFFFEVRGDSRSIGNISGITVSTLSEDPSVRPFGTSEVSLRIDSDGKKDVRYEADITKSSLSATLAGSFSAGRYAFVAFPGEYVGCRYDIAFADGSSQTVDFPDFSFSAGMQEDVDLPAIRTGDDPVPVRDTSFVYLAEVSNVQKLSDDGYDTEAVTVVGLPDGMDNPIKSLYFFNIAGDEAKISKISSIAFSTLSFDQGARPFGLVEVEVDFDAASGYTKYEFSNDLSCSYDSATLSGSFVPGEYAFVGLPGDYIGAKFVVTYSDGSSDTFDHPNYEFSADNDGAADLPKITIGSDDPGPDPDPDPVKNRHAWFELPAYADGDNDGIDDNNKDYYYSFTFRADAEKIRNFSCCYSKSKIHPVWVAAPMHSCYKGGSGRNDSYKPDPQIKCTQAGKWSGYTRGHMLGSSDRTISKPTNRQVFYYSNIGAQIQTGFNTGGGAWNNLESLVDGQWCSDTLYQVIGCIFDSWTDKYGNTMSPKTQDGSQIPTAYYKVLLRTKKGNSGKSVDKCTADELKCCAFILAHRGNHQHKPCGSDLYTVEYVEKLTGLKFFVNVPNAPKSVANAGDWGL